MNKGDKDLAEFRKQLGWDDNKFYKNIQKICSEEIYNIDINSFKNVGKIKGNKLKYDYKKGERNFNFKEDWVDLAYVLFKMFEKNPYYRSNSTSKSVSLEDIIKYNEEYLVMIEENFSDYHRRSIQLHPVYASTIIETTMMRKVSEKIRLLLAVTSTMSIEERAGMWVNLDDALNRLIIKSSVESVDTEEAIKKEKGELFTDLLHGEYEHTSIDKYLAVFLKEEMDLELKEERLKQYEERLKELELELMERRGDTPEIVDAINKEEEKRMEKEMKGIDQKIEILLTLLRLYYEDNSSFEWVIDQYIHSLENISFNKEQIEKRIEKLQGLKDKVSQYSKDSEKFKEATDGVFREINYDIINRNH